VLGTTLGNATLALTKPITYSHPSRSDNQPKFRLGHFDYFCLRNSSNVATIELGRLPEAMEAELVGYPERQRAKPSESLWLHASAGKAKMDCF
jgi:hypothetical protein